MELEQFFLLTVAGNETTRNLISGAMHAFFQHTDQWERQRLDRTLLPRAVEEMLRYVTPVMNFRRTAMRDVEFSGTKIREGDLLPRVGQSG
jgi:cytochrome P450